MVFRLLAVLSSLYLCASGALVDDRELAQLLSAEAAAAASNDNRHLLGSDFGQTMDRCGNRNPCAEGLDCTKMVAGKRCFPKECFSKKAEAFAEEGFNATAYKEMILAKAGVTEEEIIGARASAAGNHAFTTSDVFVSVMQTLKENSEPLQRILDMEEACSSPNQDLSTILARQNGTTDELQHVDYFGMQVEFGVVGEFSYSYFQPNTGRNGPALLSRYCLGAGPQAVAHVSMIAGRLVDSRNGDDLCCTSIWANADVLAAYGIGVSGGFAFNGKVMYEATIGFGVGGGGGVSTCVAFGTA